MPMRIYCYNINNNNDNTVGTPFKIALGNKTNRKGDEREKKTSEHCHEWLRELSASIAIYFGASIQCISPEIWMIQPFGNE